MDCVLIQTETTLKTP